MSTAPKSTGSSPARRETPRPFCSRRTRRGVSSVWPNCQSGPPPRAAGYTEPRVLQLLGLTALPPFRQRVEALPLYLWRTAGGTALDVLARLFLLQQPVPLDATRRALAPMRPEEWAAVGLLRLDVKEVRAAVELCPYEGLVAA